MSRHSSKFDPANVYKDLDLDYRFMWMPVKRVCVCTGGGGGGGGLNRCIITKS